MLKRKFQLNQKMSSKKEKRKPKEKTFQGTLDSKHSRSEISTDFTLSSKRKYLEEADSPLAKKKFKDKYKRHAVSEDNIKSNQLGSPLENSTSEDSESDSDSALGNISENTVNPTRHLPSNKTLYKQTMKDTSHPIKSKSKHLVHESDSAEDSEDSDTDLDTDEEDQGDSDPADSEGDEDDAKVTEEEDEFV